jgi:hypothetical protein
MAIVRDVVLVILIAAFVGAALAFGQTLMRAPTACPVVGHFDALLTSHGPGSFMRSGDAATGQCSAISMTGELR